MPQSSHKTMKKNNMINSTNKKETMKKTTPTKKKTVKNANKIAEAEVFPGLQGKFLLVKVGNHQRPATQELIDKVQSDLVELFEENNIDCVAYVTHEAITMEVIGDDRRETV